MSQRERLTPERERLLRRGGKIGVADREALLGEIDYLRAQLEEQVFRTSEAQRETVKLRGKPLIEVLAERPPGVVAGGTKAWPTDPDPYAEEDLG